MEESSAAYVLVNDKTGIDQKINDYIKKISSKYGIVEITPVFGNYDLILKLQGNNEDELKKATLNLRSDSFLSDKINGTTTLFILSSYEKA